MFALCLLMHINAFHNVCSNVKMHTTINFTSEPNISSFIYKKKKQSSVTHQALQSTSLDVAAVGFLYSWAICLKKKKWHLYVISMLTWQHYLLLMTVCTVSLSSSSHSSCRTQMSNSGMYFSQQWYLIQLLAPLLVVILMLPVHSFRRLNSRKLGIISKLNTFQLPFYRNWVLSIKLQILLFTLFAPWQQSCNCNQKASKTVVFDVSLLLITDQ